MFEADGMEEIKQIFFEESDEGLGTMESGLLNLSPGEPDMEVINDIFRAAHSIKGGSATFGFSTIAEFTHGVETLLDEMRSGVREVSPEVVELLLKSVDCIRELVEEAKAGTDQSNSKIEKVSHEINVMLGSSSAEETAEKGKISTSNDKKEEAKVSDLPGWRIEFKPFRHFLQYGNKPPLIFRELTNLGDLKVTSNLDDLPMFNEFDPIECYLSWSLELKGDIEKEKIIDVFDWVEDDCDLAIMPVGGQAEELDNAKENLDSIVTTVPDTVTKVEPEPNPEPTKAVAPDKPNKPSTTNQKAGGSIRVSIEKLDALLNLVGELVITQSMLKKVGSEISEKINENLLNGLSQLESNARELQEVAMKMRMLPINNTFTRFPRIVHDLSKQLGKKVDLQISGEQTELDKTVLEKVGDPLVHLVRNALDHGIEKPADRLAAGKNETGIMKLAAFHEAGNIVITISDDGGGLNPDKILAKAKSRGLVGDEEFLTQEQINQLIFMPGFSTAEVVSDVSGRGVGMDVVRRNIQDLGGRVEVESKFGFGSTFKIRLPLTMAILDGQLISVGRETYIIPLLSIVESVVIDGKRVNMISKGATVYQLRNQNIPIVSVDSAFGLRATKDEQNIEDLNNRLLVVVDMGNEHVGLVVDELLDQQQVVIKSLETNYKQIDGVSGATILGDGSVALILDIPGLVNTCYRKNKTRSNQEAA